MEESLRHVGDNLGGVGVSTPSQINVEPTNDSSLTSQPRKRAKLSESSTTAYQLESAVMTDSGSDNSTMRGSVKQAYVNELVAELLVATSSVRMDSPLVELKPNHVKNSMLDCLETFSLRLLATESSQPVHQDVTAFVQKYKR